VLFTVFCDAVFIELMRALTAKYSYSSGIPRLIVVTYYIIYTYVLFKNAHKSPVCHYSTCTRRLVCLMIFAYSMPTERMPVRLSAAYLLFILFQ